MQKRLYDIGWSDEKKCRGCDKEEGTEKHRLYHCTDMPGFVEGGLDMAKRCHVSILSAETLGGRATCQSKGGNLKSAQSWGILQYPCCKEVTNQIPEKLWKWEQKSQEHSNKDWKWQRGITSHPPSEGSSEEKPPDSAKMGIREAPVEGFRNQCCHRWLFIEEMGHDAVESVDGQWCSSDHDDSAMYGTLETELEVQLTAFLCLLRKAIGPTMVHVDNKGIIDGSVETRNEVHWFKSEGRRHVHLDLGRIVRISSRRQDGILVEVEHVKAHRTKKEM